MRTVGKLLAVVLTGACVCASLVPAPTAQVPFVQAYFEKSGDELTDFVYCGAPLTIDHLVVVAHNLNVWLTAIDFRIEYPVPLFWLYDEFPLGILKIGDSPTGVAIAWQTPQNAFQSIEVMRAFVIWTGDCECYGDVYPVAVSGYEGATHPTIVSWPDYAQVQILARASQICQLPYPVKPTTWGRIKALYR